MRLSIRSIFHCPVERVWTEVQTSQLMLTVIKPLVYFQPIDPPVLPATWREGAYLGRMTLFGLIPLGRHTIRISFPQTAAQREYQMRDHGGGYLIPQWDHLIVVQRLDNTRTLYRDEVDIHAGLLTLLVWLFAHMYYRYRHWRWRQLIRASFDYGRF